MEDVSRARALGGPRASLLWLLTACWAAVIFWFSSHTGSQLPKHWLLSHDKLCHGGEYALLGLLLCAALVRSGLPLTRAAALTALLALLYGASDEYHQSFVPGRQGNDPYDLFADLVGGSAGALLLLGAVALRPARRANPPPQESPA